MSEIYHGSDSSLPEESPLLESPEVFPFDPYVGCAPGIAHDDLEPLSEDIEEMWRRAHVDILSKRYNRRWIEAKLDWLIKNQPGTFSVAFIDLDGTKEINDTKGHEAGNNYLITAGETLQKFANVMNEQEASGAEPAVRLSGDEFVMIFGYLNNQTDLNRIMADITDKLLQAGVSASIGGRPHRADEDRAMLMRGVDELMYKQKKEKRLAEFMELPFRKRIAALAGRWLLQYSGAKLPRQ